MNPVFAFAANYALQAALLVSVAGIASCLARDKSAETKNLIWGGALAGILFLPVLMLFAPKMTIPIPRSRPAHIQSVAGVTQSRLITSTPSSAYRTIQSRSLPTSPNSEFPIDEIVTGVYLLGIAVLGLRWLLSWNRVNSIATQSQQVSGLGEGLARVLYADDSSFHAPVTFGLHKPTILLPSDAGEWSEDRMRAVMLHEAAHIRRRDWFWQCLADFACLILWFNPALWALSAQLRGTAEESADDATLREGIPASTYARELLSFVAMKGLHGVGMARRANVDHRVRRVLSATVDRTSPELRVSVGVFVFAGLLGLLASGFRFVPQVEENDGSRGVVHRTNRSRQTVADAKDLSGVSARIIDIARKNGSSLERWKPDGSPENETSKPPAYLKLAWFEEPVNKDLRYNSVWVFIELSGLTLQPSTVFEGELNAIDQWTTSPSTGNKAVICARLPLKSSSATVDGSIAVGTAPWQLVSTGKLGIGELKANATHAIVAQHAVYDAITKRSRIDNTYDSARTTVRIEVPSQYAGDNLELKVYDAQGKQYQSHGGSGVRLEKETGVEHLERDFQIRNPESITRVELYRRPWVKLTFKGIHVSPKTPLRT